MKPPPTPKQSTFRITPYRLELKPNEEAIVTLEGYAEEPGPVKETLVCHAIIGMHDVIITLYQNDKKLRNI